MTIRDILIAGTEIQGPVEVVYWDKDDKRVVLFDDYAEHIGDQDFLDMEIKYMFSMNKKIVFEVSAEDAPHSDCLPLTMTEAWGDVMNYLETRPEEWYGERDRTKYGVLNDAVLINAIVREHMHSVNHYGIDREWSIEDACTIEPGI